MIGGSAVLSAVDIIVVAMHAIRMLIKISFRLRAVISPIYSLLSGSRRAFYKRKSGALSGQLPLSLSHYDNAAGLFLVI